MTFGYFASGNERWGGYVLKHFRRQPSSLFHLLEESLVTYKHFQCYFSANQGRSEIICPSSLTERRIPATMGASIGPCSGAMRADKHLSRSLMKFPYNIPSLPFIFLFLSSSTSIVHSLRSYSFLLHLPSTIEAQVRFDYSFTRRSSSGTPLHNCLTMFRYLCLFAFARLALGGAILWDGRFNDMTSSSELDSWSWSNQVGPYQYYIVSPSAHFYRLIFSKLQSMVLRTPPPMST